jgi:hypothetical protein
MPSQYILPNEYVVYGLPTSTLDSQVVQASAIIDAYLMRPEGLVWSPDYLGQPCYMTALTPTQTFESTGTISPGSNVVVNLTENVVLYTDMIGEVVILDRGNPALVEACVISALATSGTGSITLFSVANNHSANCTIDFGLTIEEEKELPVKRSIMRTARPPVRLLSGLGRYGYGTRLSQQQGQYSEINLLAAIQTFGGPPLWVPFPVNQCGVSLKTNEIWVPAGLLLAYYSEVRLFYVSGFPVSGIPTIIKSATAQIISAVAQWPGFIGQLQSIGAGATKVARFAPSQLDRDTLTMLNTHRMLTLI